MLQDDLDTVGEVPVGELQTMPRAAEEQLESREAVPRDRKEGDSCVVIEAMQVSLL